MPRTNCNIHNNRPCIFEHAALKERLNSSPMSDSAQQSVSFHFHKTSSFQTVHADGVFGGVTPSGLGFIAFFNERAPMPQRIDQEIRADGSLGKVLHVEGKDGVFREIHTGVTLSREGLILLKERVEAMLKNIDGEEKV